MMVSFIVPVYNTSKYLNRCLESILCQKGADFEILLVDDGSTDNSGEMCDAYAENYPDIVRVIHKANEGLLLTRRRGFKEAKGDWFISVDSDDYISPNLLENVVRTIEQHHPDMVMYNYSYFFDDDTFEKSKLSMADESVFEGETKQQVYAKRLLTNDVNSMCMKALKREIVDIKTDYSDCGIRNMCEDAVQVLPLFTKAQKIVYLDTPLYYYRKGHGSNITTARSYESWLASKACFLMTENYLDVWNVSVELKQRFYTGYLELLSNFLRWAFSQPEGDLPKSLSDILNLINTHPSFSNCTRMYCKAYAQTSYLRLCVPKIIKYVQKENVKGLKRFFSFEKKVLSVKS